MKQTMIEPRRRRAGLRLMTAFALGLLAASAQAAFPDRPITIVVPYAEGGPTDKVARPIAKAMSRILGQEVTLEYWAGEGGTRAPREMVRNGVEDGYTLLLHHIGMATAPTLYRQLGFDPQRDFEPIGLIADAPMVLLARRDLPVAKPQDLVGYIRRNERSLLLAYAGAGAASSLCGLLLESALRVKLTWIPYTGTRPALDDLARGRVDLLCDQTTNTGEPLAAGAVRAYAVTVPRRLEVMPELPTTAEIGQQKLQIAAWHGLYSLAGTPGQTVARLSEALQQAVTEPDFVAVMTAVGVIPARPQQATPQALRRHLALETDRWRPLIQRSGQYAD